MATVADLRPCNVILVRVPLGRHGAAVVVEKRLAVSVRRIDARYLADPRSHSYPIRKGDTGAYNCRKTTSGASWSKHAYGAAVDINWQTNPYSRTLITDMPPWFRQLWKDEGWGWGGDWVRVKDAMHFSKFPNEGGDGKLETSEGDWFSMATEEQLRKVVHEELRKAIEALLSKSDVQAQRGGSHFGVARGQSVMDVLVETRSYAKAARENTTPVQPSEPGPIEG